MKTDIDMFFLNIEHFLSDIRGSRYLHLKKVYFFVGHPVSQVNEVKLVVPQQTLEETNPREDTTLNGQNLEWTQPRLKQILKKKFL